MQIVAKVQEVVARLPVTLSICLLEVLDVGGEDAIGNDLHPKIKSTCIGLHWFVLVCVGLVWLGFRFGFGLVFFPGWVRWCWFGWCGIGLVCLGLDWFLWLAFLWVWSARAPSQPIKTCLL